MAKSNVLSNSPADTFLGFDFGNKKIGIAVGHLSTNSASPLVTLRSKQQVPDWENISKIIAEWQPDGLVVGISYQADGRENPITPRMLKFTRQLAGRYRLPVHCIDESLTTFEAKQLLFDDVALGAAKLWEAQDQLAAQLILSTWLNEQQA